MTLTLMPVSSSNFSITESGTYSVQINTFREPLLPALAEELSPLLPLPHAVMEKTVSAASTTASTLFFIITSLCRGLSTATRGEFREGEFSDVIFPDAARSSRVISRDCHRAIPVNFSLCRGLSTATRGEFREGEFSDVIFPDAARSSRVISRDCHRAIPVNFSLCRGLSTATRGEFRAGEFSDD